MTGVPSACGSGAFRSFVAADVLLSFAEEMIVVAVGWLVYAHTHSAFALGMVGLAGFLPAILLSLVTGTVVDRVDRRLILIIGNAVLLAGAAGLCLVASATVIWPIYLITIIMGAAKAFLNPASLAVLPNLVASGDYTRALAVSGGIGEAAKLIGPTVGGLLFAFGPLAPFAAATAIIALSTLLWLGIGAQPPQPDQERPNWGIIIAGYRFIWSRKVILGSMSLDLVAVLLGGATALLPIYVDQIYRTGPWALGLLRTAPAIGAILTSAVLSWWPLDRHVGRILLVCVAVYGLATVGFGLSRSLPVGLAFLAVLGAADTISQIIRRALVQLQTPDGMRGRVGAVHTMVTGASNELGEFESGMLAAALGAVPAVVLGGVAAIVAALVWARLFPALTRADRMAGNLHVGQ